MQSHWSNVPFSLDKEAKEGEEGEEGKEGIKGGRSSSSSGTSPWRGILWNEMYRLKPYFKAIGIKKIDEKAAQAGEESISGEGDSSRGERGGQGITKKRKGALHYRRRHITHRCYFTYTYLLWRERSWLYLCTVEAGSWCSSIDEAAD